MKHFANWGQFSDWLENRGLFHMELGLGRMREAMRLLKLENPPFLTAQVLGTNGKGSTATFLANIAQAHGVTTGLYTSPHLVSPRERVLVNGRQIPDAGWLSAANAIQTSPAGELGLTYFEFLTVLALLVFQRAGVRTAIFEAGLGGKNDATTAIPAHVLCFAPIAMDHAAIIGPTLADIAADKAGAIRSDAPIFSAPQFPAAKKLLALAAARHGAPLCFPAPLQDGRAGLLGSHQRVNAAIALAAWRQLCAAGGISPLEEVECSALASAFIPGRLQRVPGNSEHPPILLDGAHNPHGVHALAEYLQNNSITPRALIFSSLGDKDWQSGLGMLCRRMAKRPILLVELANERAGSTAQMAAFCKGATGRAAAEFVSLENALAACGPDDGNPDAVLVCGSFYLLAEFFSLYPQYLQAGARGNTL